MKAQPDRVPIFLLVIILMGSLVSCTANEEAAPSATATVERTALVSATIPPTPATSTPDAIPPTATATENAVPPASDTTTEALPEAMVLHETDEFSILLPEGMEVLNPTDRLSQDTLEQFGDNNPALASMMPSEQDLERIQLYALETDIPEESVGGFNFVLFRIPVSEFGEIELQRDVIDPFVNAYEESGVTVIEVNTEMEIADTAAARVAYELPMNLPSGSTITGGILQYLVLGSENLWIFNYTIEIERSDELVPLAEQSAQSFILKAESAAEPPSESDSATESVIESTTEGAPAGMVRHEHEDFAILLPEGWEVQPSEPEIDDEMLDANPGMAGLLQDESNSLLFASEGAPSNPELGAGNIGITRYPSSDPAEGEFQRGIVAAADLLKTTEGFTVRNVAMDIEVAGYPAALTTYILELNIPNAGTFFVEGRQYYLQTSEHVWVLTYTFPQSRTEELLPLIEQSASSLEVKAEE